MIATMRRRRSPASETPVTDMESAIALMVSSSAVLELASSPSFPGIRSAGIPRPRKLPDRGILEFIAQQFARQTIVTPVGSPAVAMLRRGPLWINQ